MAEFKPYQKKKFLVVESMSSMASIHCKIKESGEYQIRIADCNRTIKLWGDLNSEQDCKEVFEKINTLQTQLELFKNELKLKLGSDFIKYYELK